MPTDNRPSGFRPKQQPTDTCDMDTGPCSCGAWHEATDLPGPPWWLTEHSPGCDGTNGWEAECLMCGAAECPHDDPMHFHHDGCPSCMDDEDAKRKGE